MGNSYLSLGLIERNIQMTLMQKVIKHLKHREGTKTIVYLDTLGKPTVGVGHLVLPEDNLKVGDKITKARIEKFLAEDSLSAIEAAKKQAIRLGHKDNEDFIVALAAVNYQLGADWPSEWPNTFNLLKHREYQAAILVFKGSKWQKQTPVRVKDFIKALQKLDTPVILEPVKEKRNLLCWIRKIFYFLKP